MYDEYKMHKQAFLKREVEAQVEKGAGKNKRYEYIYKTFNEFFNYEKAERQLRDFEEEVKEKQQVTQKDIAAMVAAANKNKVR